MAANLPSTMMVFISCDGEHFAQFPVSGEVGSSLGLIMERLSSWAIDERDWVSALITPNKDEEGNTYFELDCVDQSGTRFLLIAAVFRATIS